MTQLSTCLWFDGRAEEAAAFYVAVFPAGRILKTSLYPEGSPGTPGSVLTVRFTLNGVAYTAFNGMPGVSFSPAISLVATCADQAEVDRLWAALSEGGQVQQCGWLTDRFGVCWQIVPAALIRMIEGDDPAATQRAFSAMLDMIKLDIAALEQAYRSA